MTSPLSSEQKASPARLRQVRECISDYMDAILKEFRPGAKITVLVRTPGVPEGDLLLTNDQMDEIAAAIERSKTRPES